MRSPAQRMATTARATAARATAATRAGGGGAPRRRLGVVALCGALIVVALLSALWINISLTRGSYAASDLRSRSTLLAEQEQALQEHLQEVSSAQALDARAQAMGMVRASESGWLVLEAPQDQAVVGDPAPATPSPEPTAPAPSSAPSSAPSAGETPSGDPSSSATTEPAPGGEPTTGAAR